MKQPNTYHTHTFRCKHASGSVIDYCREAVNAGMKYIGITDHTPFPDNRWPEPRMHMNELATHLEDVQLAKDEMGELTIFSAMECEYVEDFNEFYKNELLGKHQLDYLVGAIHYIPADGEWKSSFNLNRGEDVLKYGDYFIKAMESGLFHFMAHPEIFAIPHISWSDELQKTTENILSAAESIGMPLELNTYGFRKPHHQLEDGETLATYPREEFWKTAKNYKLKVIVNSDAHRPEDVAAGYELADAWVQKYQLETIELSDYLLGKKDKDW